MTYSWESESCVPTDWWCENGQRKRKRIDDEKTDGAGESEPKKGGNCDCHRTQTRRPWTVTQSPARSAVTEREKGKNGKDTTTPSCQSARRNWRTIHPKMEQFLIADFIALELLSWFIPSCLFFYYYCFAILSDLLFYSNLLPCFFFAV